MFTASTHKRSHNIHLGFSVIDMGTHLHAGLQTHARKNAIHRKSYRLGAVEIEHPMRIPSLSVLVIEASTHVTVMVISFNDIAL